MKQPPEPPAELVEAADTVHMDQEQVEANRIKEELEVVNTMIVSLKGATSAASVQRRQELQAQATALQHDMTKHKSLETQAGILQACVTRREKSLAVKEGEASAAMAAVEAAQDALGEARMELSRVQALLEAQKLDHENESPQPVSDMVTMAKRMLPESHLNGFLECIQLMRDAAKAAAAAPTPVRADPYIQPATPQAGNAAISGPMFFGVQSPSQAAQGTTATPITPARGRAQKRSTSPSISSPSVRSRSKVPRATSSSPRDHFSRRERLPFNLG